MEAGGIHVPGIDLEPLEPFLDDVFAGMDDHPPGLWHPALLEASRMQQHASHSADGAHTGPLDLDVAQQTDEQRSSPFDCGHSELEAALEQPESAVEQPHTLQSLLEPHNSPGQLQRHQLSATHSSNLSSYTQPDFKAASCTILQPAGDVVAVLDLQCSHSSSTLSPVAAADELTASSNSLGLEAGAAYLAEDRSVDVLLQGSADVQPQRMETPGSSSSDPIEERNAASFTISIAADVAAPSVEAIHENAATSDSSSTRTAEPTSPHDSVPDIDEVSEEQQPAVCETYSLPAHSASLPPPAMSLQGEEQHQQHDLWIVDSMGKPQPEDRCTAAISPHHQHYQQWQEHGQQQAHEQQQAQAEQNLEHHDPKQTQLASSLANVVLEDVQNIGAASKACHVTAGTSQPDSLCTQLIGASRSTAEVAVIGASAQYAADTAAADDAEVSDSGEFVSPSTSWHSCMTQASQASSYSIMSAASFATAKGLSALPVAARLVEQQTVPPQQQLQQVPIEAAASSKGLTLTVAGQPAVHSAVMSAAPVIDSSDSSAAAATAGNGCPAMAPVEHDSSWGPCGLHPYAADQQSQQSEPPLGQPTKQQQQWQQELWQDVSPPSLGSSPPTPSGYTTVHPMHMHEVPAAAVTADATAPTGAAGPGAPTQLGSFVESMTTVLETSDSVPDQGDAQYYSHASPVQVQGDLGPVAGRGQAAAAGAGAGAGGLPQHLPGARTVLYPHNLSIANSSYVLRQSELVDLSLSMSVHPSQHQQFRPGWLTAHQQLPPAAAQAVERAVCALNDSYFFHERLGQSPMQQRGPTAPGAHAMHSASPLDVTCKPADVSPASAGMPAGGLGASGLLGPELIRRPGGGGLWSHASTQPQQDQQARHRLPSHGTQQSGWARPGVLGQWFSGTVQQPLAAVASLAAAGVGQRLVAAGLKPASNSAVSPTTTVSSGTAGPCDVGIQDAVLIEHTPDLPQSLQEQEDTAFQGLLFLGGQDSHGRPVVVINTDAIPAGQNSAPRDAALAYLLNKLTPLVLQGPYVLVLVAFQHGPQFRLLPAVWCVRAYHSLPRAFRKHVKHVVLLQPSFMVRAGLALLYPFVSSKAHAKIKQVHRLLDIESATSGEVQVPHLGEAFLTTVQQLRRAEHQGAAGQAADGTSRTVPVPGALQD